MSKLCRLSRGSFPPEKGSFRFFFRPLGHLYSFLITSRGDMIGLSALLGKLVSEPSVILFRSASKLEGKAVGVAGTGMISRTQ